MPIKPDSYQSVIPEVICVQNRPYVTLELLNQARKSYAHTRQTINLRTGNTTLKARMPTRSRYQLADAEFCQTHSLEEIKAKYGVAQSRAYQLKHYLPRQFGL